jgi:hypothetical protein
VSVPSFPFAFVLWCPSFPDLFFFLSLPSLCSFLDDLYRIAHRRYEPTDDDVVRARLRTMGIQEYRFIFETGDHFYLQLFEDMGVLTFGLRAGGGA